MHAGCRQTLLKMGLGALVVITLAGCGGGQGERVPPLQAGLGCVDDSMECRTKRQTALETLLADQQHAWIGQPVDAAAYASGVRLFAYKKRKRHLNCGELAMGEREAKAARATLRTAGDQLTPAQISRGAMLGDEIALELAKERRRRGCRA